MDMGGRAKSGRGGLRLVQRLGAARARPGRRRPGGFTLIELLVVVAVIALLIAILLPSLTRAKELARRSQCAANLHQLGCFVAVYMTDYNDKVYPVLVPSWIDIWGACYLPDAWMASWWDQQAGRYGLTPASVTCPSVPGYVMGKWGVGDWVWYNTGAYNIAYNYFGGPEVHATGRISYWKDFELTAARTARESNASTRYLAMDRVNIPASGLGLPARTYFANHGTEGQYSEDRALLGGSNQLFLDGHVTWKPGDQFPPVFDHGTAPFLFQPGWWNPAAWTYGAFW